MCAYVRAYRAYDATQAYAVSKLANVLHTNELAKRLQVVYYYCSLTLRPKICVLMID